MKHSRPDWDLNQWQEANILEIIYYSEAYWSASGEEIVFRLTLTEVHSHLIMCNASYTSPAAEMHYGAQETISGKLNNKKFCWKFCSSSLQFINHTCKYLNYSFSLTNRTQVHSYFVNYTFSFFLIHIPKFIMHSMCTTSLHLFPWVSTL